MTSLSLPRWAHRPGRTEAPDRTPLEEAKRRLPARYEGEVPADDEIVRYGLRLHDEGFFWEAHEVWEAVWKAAPMNGRDRLALRALIQIANAGLKRALRQPRAVERLVRESQDLLTELANRGSDPRGTGVAARLDVSCLVRDLAAMSDADRDGPLLVLQPLLEPCTKVQETGPAV